MATEENSTTTDIVAELQELLPAVHAQTKPTIKRAIDEIDRLRADLARSQASEERAWRERNHAVTKVRAWESVVVAERITAFRVEEWGPGEGDQVNVALPEPRRLTEALDELATLRKARPTP